MKDRKVLEILQSKDDSIQDLEQVQYGLTWCIYKEYDIFYWQKHCNLIIFIIYKVIGQKVTGNTVIDIALQTVKISKIYNLATVNRTISLMEPDFLLISHNYTV